MQKLKKYVGADMEKTTVIVTWSISQALEWIKYVENPWETALFTQRQ